MVKPTVEGLGLSLMGITITFAALGLLVLVIVVLERLFRDRSFIPKGHENRVVDSTLARDTGEEEVVAAIAVALAYLHSLDLSRSGLGTTLESGRGSWWVMGKIQQRSVDSSRRR